jgi:hypothetical protein
MVERADCLYYIYNSSKYYLSNQNNNLNKGISCIWLYVLIADLK